MLVVLQLFLLLCVGSSVSQDLMTPNVNIIAELEKLQKMEEKIQTLQETLNKVLSNNEALKSLVQDLQTKLESFQKENEALKSLVQNSQTKLESFQQENKALKSLAQNSQTKLESFQQENKALKSLVQDLQTKLESFEKENKARKIAFSAGLLASGEGYVGPFKDSEILVYKKVFSNIGNAYDSNTGIFTAPVKGAYYFRFYAHSRAPKNMGASLYKNDVHQCSVFTWQPPTNSNASNGVILTLEPGDRVHIKVWDNARVFDDGSSFTSFSGFLIFPL